MRRVDWLLAFSLLLGAAPSDAQPAVRQVLMLQSVDRAQAGRMMITANRATPDTMGEILSDIEGEGVQATQIIDRHRTMLQSHQLDRKPIDLQALRRSATPEVLSGPMSPA